LERISIPLALRLGADLVCHKPVDKRGLMEIIHRLEANAFGMTSAAPPLNQHDIVCVNA
jgi:hypothetical protein